MSVQEFYTDGACSGNPGKGAWSFVYRDVFGKYQGFYGKSDQTTNNIMELTGILKALEFIKEKGIDGVVIYSDSKYAVDGIYKWLPNWKRNNWLTASKKPVKNQDLWKEIDELLYLPMKLEWVKGHSDHKGNQMADQVAQCAVGNHVVCKCESFSGLELMTGG